MVADFKIVDILLELQDNRCLDDEDIAYLLNYIDKITSENYTYKTKERND